MVERFDNVQQDLIDVVIDRVSALVNQTQIFLSGPFRGLQAHRLVSLCLLHKLITTKQPHTGTAPASGGGKRDKKQAFILVII